MTNRTLTRWPLACLFLSVNESARLKVYNQGLFTLKLLAEYQETPRSVSNPCKKKMSGRGSGGNTLESQSNI